MFFAKDKLTKFKNLGSVLGTGKLEWSIKIKDFKYKKASAFVSPEPTNHLAGKKVFFDSTTKWTWVSNDILT